MKRLDSFAGAAQWGRLHLRDRGYGGEGGRARPSPEELLLYWPFPSLLLSSMAFIRIAMMMCAAAKGVVVDGAMVGGGDFTAGINLATKGERRSRVATLVLSEGKLGPLFLRRNIVLEGESERVG